MKVRYAKEYNDGLYDIFKIYEDGSFRSQVTRHADPAGRKFIWKPTPMYDGDWYNEEITEAEAFLEMV